MADDTLLKSGLAYAQMFGWAVLPLKARDKTPLTPHGVNDASTDPAIIRGWWARWPDANIGLACGPSGLVVIDLDADRNGLDTWAELCQRHGINGDGALVSLTGGGGQHLVFSANGAPVSSSAGKLGPGVDVRANGGYIVAPPSVHPNGQVYAWEVSAHPKDRKPATLPAALAALLTDNGKAPRQADPLPERIPSGQRNHILASLAGSMRRRGASESAILAALEAENAQRCDPPLEHGELEHIAASIARYPAKARPLGQRFPKAEAVVIETIAPNEPPDPALRQAIIDTLLGLGLGEGEKPPPLLLRRQQAGRLLLDWLADNGGFVQSEAGERFYFYRPARRLFRLDAESWPAFLFVLTGIYPATTDFACLADECKTAAMTAPRRPVVRVSTWNEAEQVLRVSRFDGTVYRLDGQTIAEEANGETALFDDDPLWPPYEPVFSTPGALEWSTTHLPHWTGDDEAHGLAFRAWVLSSFFTELCPSRPLLVFLGEKGSGKSMALRVLLRLLFGPGAQVAGIPDRPDGFTAAAAASHLLVLDNLDQFTGWLRDRLARIATGANDQYRKLYTSNEVGHVIYRCWLAFTARTPDTLKRDDLADRLLLLPVARIDDDERKRETDFFDQTAAMRPDWWGDVLTALNQAVAAIRRGELRGASRLRLADWEALGRVFARNEGQEALWDSFVDGLKRTQSDFLLEGDLIVEALEAWLADGENHGRQMTTKDLHQELTVSLSGEHKPPADWPKSTVSFGKRLAGIRRDLAAYYRVEWGRGTGNKQLYQFWPLGGES
ncbi:MAG: bifunctional DNA primase/polymerase [Chloroflexota bacterium]